MWVALKPLFQIGECQLNDEEEGCSSVMRNIVLITDGQISNERYVLNMIRENKNHSLRLFTLGIGKSINRYLIKKMAITGGGTHLYLPLGDNKMACKLNDLIEKTKQPSLSDISVKWNTNDQNFQVQQVPEKIESIFSGKRQIVYGLIDYCTRATLFAKFGQQTLENSVSTTELLFKEGNLLHRLCARNIIREKDSDDAIYDDPHLSKLDSLLLKKKFKQEIIKMGIEYSLVTPYTSFVASKNYFIFYYLFYIYYLLFIIYFILLFIIYYLFYYLLFITYFIIYCLLFIFITYFIIYYFLLFFIFYFYFLLFYFYFTIYFLVEEREENENFEKIPKIDDLIEKENVDILSYINWKDELIISDFQLIEMLSDFEKERIDLLIQKMLNENRWKLKQFKSSPPTQEEFNKLEEISLNDDEKLVKNFFLVLFLFLFLFLFFFFFLFYFFINIFFFFFIFLF